MEESLSSSNPMILTDDLKIQLLICENNQREIDVFKQTVDLFVKQSQSQELLLNKFSFGPLVMRLAYHLNRPDLAFKLMKRVGSPKEMRIVYN